MDSTPKILDLFTQISAIPRRSTQEERAARWVCGWADQHGFTCQADQAGNLLIDVQASPGWEDRPGLVLQAHLDMVCEKTPDTEHDFSKDPLRLLVEGDWMRADGTTLGADNGIGVALAMALAEDEDAPHPPLELLFTVEEEIGLAGANRMAEGWLKGKRLINLDAEEEGVFLTGCAGGRGTKIELTLLYELPQEPMQTQVLEIRGLQGGHSGTDIHKHRASANQLLARALHHARQAAPVLLSALDGGSAHNAISRQARALLLCPPKDLPALENALKNLQTSLRREYTSESELAVVLEEWQGEVPPALSESDTARVFALILALPHGVMGMSAEVEGFVETSCNLALLKLDEEGLHIVSSQRSSVMSRMDELTARIEAIAYLAGAEAKSSKGNPAWQPDQNSALLEQSRAAYRKLFNKEPAVRMIHAGLECGIIGAKHPGLDMISLGVTSENAHSPAERMYLPSISKVYALVKEVAAA
jgi:dipeptidase D